MSYRRDLVNFKSMVRDILYLLIKLGTAIKMNSTQNKKGVIFFSALF